MAATRHEASAGRYDVTAGGKSMHYVADPRAEGL